LREDILAGLKEQTTMAHSYPNECRKHQKENITRTSQLKVSRLGEIKKKEQC
jgi:hypothetical protein